MAFSKLWRKCCDCCECGSVIDGFDTPVVMWQVDPNTPWITAEHDSSNLVLKAGSPPSRPPTRPTREPQPPNTNDAAGGFVRMATCCSAGRGMMLCAALDMDASTDRERVEIAIEQQGHNAISLIWTPTAYYINEGGGDIALPSAPTPGDTDRLCIRLMPQGNGSTQRVWYTINEGLVHVGQLSYGNPGNQWLYLGGEVSEAASDGDSFAVFSSASLICQCCTTTLDCGSFGPDPAPLLDPLTEQGFATGTNAKYDAIGPIVNPDGSIQGFSSNGFTIDGTQTGGVGIGRRAQFHMCDQGIYRRSSKITLTELFRADSFFAVAFTGFNVELWNTDTWGNDVMPIFGNHNTAVWGTMPFEVEHFYYTTVDPLTCQAFNRVAGVAIEGHTISVAGLNSGFSWPPFECSRCGGSAYQNVGPSPFQGSTQILSVGTGGTTTTARDFAITQDKLPEVYPGMSVQPITLAGTGSVSDRQALAAVGLLSVYDSNAAQFAPMVPDSADPSLRVYSWRGSQRTSNVIGNAWSSYPTFGGNGTYRTYDWNLTYTFYGDTGLFEIEGVNEDGDTATQGTDGVLHINGTPLTGAVFVCVPYTATFNP